MMLLMLYHNVYGYLNIHRDKHLIHVSFVAVFLGWFSAWFSKRQNGLANVTIVLHGGERLRMMKHGR